MVTNRTIIDRQNILMDSHTDCYLFYLGLLWLGLGPIAGIYLSISIHMPIK